MRCLRSPSDDPQPYSMTDGTCRLPTPQRGVAGNLISPILLAGGHDDRDVIVRGAAVIAAMAPIITSLVRHRARRCSLLRHTSGRGRYRCGRKRGETTAALARRGAGVSPGHQRLCRAEEAGVVQHQRAAPGVPLPGAALSDGVTALWSRTYGSSSCSPLTYPLARLQCVIGVVGI